MEIDDAEEKHPETVRVRIDHHEIDPDTAKPIPAEWVDYVRADVHARVVEELQAELDQSLHVIKTQAAELEEQRRWRAIVATEAKELGDQVDTLRAQLAAAPGRKCCVHFLYPCPGDTP